jgi:hypothetical protein
MLLLVFTEHYKVIPLLREDVYYVIFGLPMPQILYPAFQTHHALTSFSSASMEYATNLSSF